MGKEFLTKFIIKKIKKALKLSRTIDENHEKSEYRNHFNDCSHCNFS